MTDGEYLLVTGRARLQIALDQLNRVSAPGAAGCAEEVGDALRLVARALIAYDKALEGRVTAEKGEKP